MSKFIMLVGIPASGKSTKAEELAEQYNAEILSSDKLREELLGDVNAQADNVDIFAIMREDTKEMLEDGINVVYDATNLNRKKRMALLNDIGKDHVKICYYMNIHYYMALTNNAIRERSVPVEVMNRMYKNNQFPVYGEGWHEIHIINQHTKDFTSVMGYVDSKEHYEKVLYNKDTSYEEFIELFGNFRDFYDVIDLPQDNPHHTYSVSRHIFYVYKNVRDNYLMKDMIWASVFHDIGKAFTKSFYNYKGEKKDYANFIGHEHVSSQLACYYMSRMGFEENFIYKVCELISLHMRLLNAGEKGKDRLYKMVGTNVYQNLINFRNADMEAK